MDGVPKTSSDKLHFISADAIDAIHRHLADAYPNEGCGILIGSTLKRGSVAIHEAKGTRNAERESGRDRYEIDPRDFMLIERELDKRRDGSRIVGFFHSHPDARPFPSTTDLEAAQGLFDVTQEFYVYAIYSVKKGIPEELTVWRLSNDGRTFQRLNFSKP